MSGAGAFFPNSVWDGTTLKAGTHGHSPTPQEWDQLIEEVARIEQRLISDYFWDDVQIDSFTKKGSADPSLKTWLSAFELYQFGGAAPNKILYFWKQLPHQWVVGTPIRPHVHWVTDSGAVGAVKWSMDYTIQNVGSVFPAAANKNNNVCVCGDTTLITNKHYITALGEIATTGLKESAMIIGRLFRDAADTTNDTFANDALLLELDLHVLKRVSPGSIAEYGDN